MTSLKMLLFLIFTILTSFSFSQVQRKTRPLGLKDTVEVVKGSDEMDKKEMMRELNLTREQKIKMKEIRQSGKAKKETIDNDDTLTPEQKKEKLKELRKEQLQKVQAILTVEQREQMRAMRQSGNIKKESNNKAAN